MTITQKIIRSTPKVFAKNKNIFQLTEHAVLPIVVCRTVWNDFYQYPVIVTDVVKNSLNYGKAYGFPFDLANWKVSDHFDYCAEYRHSNSIPNAGSYQWMKWLNIPQFMINNWVDEFQESLQFQVHNRV